ncbi:MAG: hypothetical protein LBI81_02145 [Puniceicoccales bacterium]|nr:hypothetical protein [Puniceicoccales bacterium]
MRNFRRIADEIYEKFPFFYLPLAEFKSRCLPLQCCGAGIVLGYAESGFEVRIIEVARNSICEIQHSDQNLPLGHWGEIIFRESASHEFTHTELYGFFDQRKRIWCCGKIKDTVALDGKKYFPYCLESLFERLWWVRRARLKFTGDAFGPWELQMSVSPWPLLLWPIKIFAKFFLRKLKSFSEKFKISSEIQKFSIEIFND